MTNMHTGQMSVLATVSIGMALGTMALWLAGASAASGPSCPSSARTMARLEMVFGTSRLQSAPVSGEEWARFLDNEVTPRFPDGFTVLQGPGQWRGNDGRLAKEVSNILVIWHEPTRRTATAPFVTCPPAW
jgi:hypothetical protein